MLPRASCALAQAATGTVATLAPAGMTVTLPENWTQRELLPTDTYNGVLLVAVAAKADASLDMRLAGDGDTAGLDALKAAYKADFVAETSLRATSTVSRF